MTWLAMLLHVEPDLLRLVTALLGLVAAACTATSTVLGVLNRRARLRTEAATASTNGAVLALVDLLTAQKADREALWRAYLAKDEVATPDGVRRIASEAAASAVEADLLPMRRFFAAVELVEHRREHRPQTDLLTILADLEGVAA